MRLGIGGGQGGSGSRKIRGDKRMALNSVAVVNYFSFRHDNTLQNKNMK